MSTATATPESLCVVMPCYNEAAGIEQTVKEVDTKLLSLIQAGRIAENSCILLADDGSKDNTWAIIEQLHAEYPRLKASALAGNRGKEYALFAGLMEAKELADIIICMDADLQHPPELLPEMIDTIQNEGYDVVAARRVSRKGEPKIKSFFSHLFYKVFNRISEMDLVEGATDYRVMTRQVVDSILQLSEYNRFTKGLFQWVGFETKWIPYENVERIAGETTWSFWGLFKYSIEGIVAFTTAPLSISTFLGTIISVVAFIYMIFIIAKYLLYSDSVQGFATIMCGILLLGGIQLLSIGILGKYLEKTYKETKNRPIFIVKETNIDDE